MTDRPHRQSGPPITIGDYLVRVIDDEVHSDVLSKATRTNPALVVGYQSGTTAREIIVRKDRVDMIAGQDNRHIPADVLATVLKLAGWKVKRPGEPGV